MAEVTINQNDFDSLNQKDWVSDNMILSLLRHFNNMHNNNNMHFISRIVISPAIFNLVMGLGMEYAQSDIPQEYFDENNREFLIPVNRNNGHWILIRLLRDDLIIEVYDPMQKDQCEQEVDFLLKLESVFGGKYDVQHKRNFAKQLDGYNCGVIILTICYRNFEIEKEQWNYDEYRSFFQQMVKQNIKPYK